MIMVGVMTDIKHSFIFIKVDMTLAFFITPIFFKSNFYIIVKNHNQLKR